MLPIPPREEDTDNFSCAHFISAHLAMAASGCTADSPSCHHFAKRAAVGLAAQGKPLQSAPVIPLLSVTV